LNPGVLDAPIYGFGRHDTVDLRGLKFHPGAKATYDHGTGQLAVHSGLVTETLTFVSPAGMHFHVASDHHGGTDVFLVFA
jgi:phage baseplate assembly protein gpV